MSSAAPSPAAPSSRWRFVLTPRWLAWHVFTVAAVVGMLWLGDWQFRRALGGNALSWAYTFEWPVFAVFGVVFWAKTILDAGRPAAAQAKAPAAAQNRAEAGLDLPGAGGPAGGGPDGAAEEEADPDLDQYNAYLDRLNRQAQAGRGRRPR